MRVEYPVALDSDYGVWQAFSNHYWPAVYIADAEGRIRHHQFGEGGYDECERIIQQLLREAGREDVADDFVSVRGDGLEAQADWSTLESPETYVGYQQGRNFASPGGVTVDEPRTYSVPDPLRLNSWALSGDWAVEGRASVLQRAGGTIAFRFHARDVHLVLRSQEGTPVSFRVLLDGAPPGTRATGWTPTSRAAGRWSSPGSINWSGSRDRLPTARSRSPSTAPASRPTCSPSASEEGEIRRRASGGDARGPVSGPSRRACSRAGSDRHGGLARRSALVLGAVPEHPPDRGAEGKSRTLHPDGDSGSLTSSKWCFAITARRSGFGMPLRFVLPSPASAYIVASNCSNWSAGRTSHRKRAAVSPLFQKRCAVPGSTTTFSPGPAMIVLPPALNPTSPSRISKTSVWYGWMWAAATKPSGSTRTSTGRTRPRSRSQSGRRGRSRR